MLLYKVIFGSCLVLLFVIYAARKAATEKGDQSQIRVLHFLRLGLSLSAIAYLLRITNPPPHGSLLFLGLACSLLGTAFLWVGWIEHLRLRTERRNAHFVPPNEEDVPVPQAILTSLSAASLSPLAAPAHQAVLQAQREADLQHHCGVDTEHLLLGLLSDSSSAGVRLLEALNISPQKVHLELLGQMASARKFSKPQAPTNPLGLTDCADQVLVLAAQEAHRFDKACVGTEHLLLGLVLVGKGKAAEVLFREGVSVDQIREEIIKARTTTGQR